MTIFPVSREKREEIQALFAGRCEWCDGRFPASALVLHELVPDSSRGMAVSPSPDPQKHFLHLCRDCHRDLHRKPLPWHLQRDLVRARPMALRKSLREVLGYVAPPYEAPGDFDLPEIYEECFSLRSLDLFRAGG
jgi:hypothetical protein